MVKKKVEVEQVELPKTRMQEKKEVHEKAAEERASAQKALKAHYSKVKDDPAVLDLISKIHGFVEYHTKVAKDGVAFENVKDVSGKVSQQTLRFTPEQRVSHLDKAAGLEEILDYLDRQLS